MKLPSVIKGRFRRKRKKSTSQTLASKLILGDDFNIEGQIKIDVAGATGKTILVSISTIEANTLA